MLPEQYPLRFIPGINAKTCWEKEKKGLSFWIPAETCPRRLLSGTCGKDAEGRWEGRKGQTAGRTGRGSLSPVMPARSPSVMPDGFYRASSVFSSPSSGTSCHARPPWISSEDGFPLKTCGNDRKGGRREERKGLTGRTGRGGISPSVMPDGFYRASSVFSSPSSGTSCHARPPWISSEDGFPLKTCGNDRRGNGKDGRETTEGRGRGSGNDRRGDWRAGRKRETAGGREGGTLRKSILRMKSFSGLKPPERGYDPACKVIGTCRRPDERYHLASCGGQSISTRRPQ